MTSSLAIRSVEINRPRVLIVDDDPALLKALPDAIRLRMSEVMVDTAESATAALDQIDATDYDVIVTDIKMPGMDGFGLLSEIRARRPDTPTLMITGHGEHALAVGALRGGAFDFIQKPIDREYFVVSLRRAIDLRELGRRRKEQQFPLRWLISPSPQMERIVEQIKQVADSPLTILVEGETGTGKELVARAIHQLSARRKKPLVVVDCGALPETLIESELFGYEKGAFTGAYQRKEGRFPLADGGSLFLDEMANLPASTQSKLLRALQERQVQPLGGRQPIRVDVRIIGASNVSLESEVRAGRFRQDVYYRLNEFVIVLPPLRTRDDILALANDFAAEASAELGRSCRGISNEAGERLLRYSWPGNVRQLRNVIRRAIVLASDVIEPMHLTFLGHDTASTTAVEERSAPIGPSLKEIAETAAAEAEQRAIRQTLHSTKGNKTEAARLLRTDYKTLHLRMKQYGISAEQFREFVPTEVTRH